MSSHRQHCAWLYSHACTRLERLVPASYGCVATCICMHGVDDEPLAAVRKGGWPSALRAIGSSDGKPHAYAQCWQAIASSRSGSVVMCICTHEPPERSHICICMHRAGYPSAQRRFKACGHMRIVSAGAIGGHMHMHTPRTTQACFPGMLPKHARVLCCAAPARGRRCAGLSWPWSRHRS